MSRVVVVGAGGLLGHKLCQHLSGHEVFGLVRKPAAHYERFAPVFAGAELIGGVDVLHGERLEETIQQLRADVVVNCVGVVKQRPEATDACLSISINALLPHRLERVCSRIGARLIHISTDCVFDGQRGGYLETDAVDAGDLYGRSKALGEVGEGSTTALTLRASFIGRELSTPTHGLLDWFLAQQGGRVDGYARVVYSGLTSIELSRAIATVIDRGRGRRGLYHVASEPITKYQLLELLREVFGIDVEIRPVDEPVLDRSLRMEEFSREFGYRPPSWREMVREIAADPTPYAAWRSPGKADCGAAEIAASPPARSGRTVP